MRKILVTGGCGFIGANLLPMLRKKGYQITIFDNFSRGKIEHLDDPSAYKLVQGDIRDEGLVADSAAGHDAIIHLAAYGSVVESIKSPMENFSVNVEGTFRVLNAARSVGVRRFIFSSTGGALVGNATPPVDERSVPRPISPYGASKLAGEAYCSAFASSYDISVTSLRFANVVGPISLHKRGAVTAFYTAMIRGEALRIFGDGTATRDFLYVGDLGAGIIAALDATKPGFSVYHLASGREVSVKELANIARNAASLPDHPIVFDSKRKGEVERNFASSLLAKEELGFTPRVSLEEAMAITWNWFSSRSVTIKGAG